jgi:hypothetical protein
MTKNSPKIMFTVISRVFTNQFQHTLFITSVSDRSLHLLHIFKNLSNFCRHKCDPSISQEFQSDFWRVFWRLAQRVLCASGYRLANTAKRTSQDLNECDSLVFTRKKGFCPQPLKQGNPQAWQCVDYILWCDWVDRWVVLYDITTVVVQQGPFNFGAV